MVVGRVAVLIFLVVGCYGAFDDCLVPQNQDTYSYMDCGIGVPASDDSTGAVYHVRAYASGSIELITKLQPTNLTKGDQFGCSISIDTHLQGLGFVVGACGDSTFGTNAGAAYLCGLTGSWSDCQQKYYGNTTDFSTTNAQFGTQVSMVGGDFAATSLNGYAKMFAWSDFEEPGILSVDQTFPVETAGGVNDEGWVMVGDTGDDAAYFLGQSSPSGNYFVQQKIDGPQGSSFGAFMRNSYPEATSMVGAPQHNSKGSVFVMNSISCDTSICDCSKSSSYFCFGKPYEIPAPVGAIGQFGQHLLPSQVGLWGISSLGAVYQVEQNNSGKLVVTGTIIADDPDSMAYFVGFRKSPSGALFCVMRQYLPDGSVKVYVALQSNNNSWTVLNSIVIPTQ